MASLWSPRLRAAALPLAGVVLLVALVEAKDAGGGWKETTNEEGKVVQQLKIEAPAMTEEDQYGYNMPDRYRCDSCKAVMFHLDRELRKKHPKNRRMKQWEYTDVFDETCRTTGFEGYGIRLVDGENALSGPGLPRAEKLAPGSGAIQMSSENWSKRLGEVCRKIVYERMGEDEVYEHFYRKLKAETSSDAGGEEGALGLGEDFCIRELKECQTGPKPPPPMPDEGQPKPAKSKTKKPDKNKEKKSDKKAKVVAPSDGGKKDAAAAGGDKVDVQTFLRNLAVRHGLTSDEYLASRTTAEWEKLMVAMAGRLFNRFVEPEL